VTVIHNGVVLHHRKEYIGCTDGVGGVAHGSVSHLRHAASAGGVSSNCRITGTRCISEHLDPHAR